jgi:hypothetical protein
MKDQARRLLITAAAYAMAAAAFGDPDARFRPLPTLPEPRPRGYGVHLSKAERRGKTPAQLQAMREERMAAVGGLGNSQGGGHEEVATPGNSVSDRSGSGPTPARPGDSP